MRYSLFVTFLIIIILGIDSQNVISEDLTIGFSGDFGSDPHQFPYSRSDKSFRFHLFDALVSKCRQGTFSNALANEWRYKDDKFIFSLREGVKFQNGKEFSAEDVDYSLKRASGQIDRYPGILKHLNIEWKVIEKYEIEISTQEPFYLLETLSTLPILSKQAKDLNFIELFKGGFGTGPFIMIDFKPRVFSHLIRNDLYWGEKPYWKNATLIYIPDDSTRIASLMTGAVNLIDNIPSKGMEIIRKNKNLRLIRSQSWYLFALHISNKFDNLSNLTTKIREAIALAIDKDKLISRVPTFFSRADQFMPEGMSGYVKDIKKKAYVPDHAKRILEDLRITDMELKILVSEIIFSKEKIALGEIENMLENVGFNVNIDMVNWSSFVKCFRDNNYMLALSLQWMGNPDIALKRLLGKLSNKKINNLLMSARQKVGEERERSFKEAIKLALQENKIIPLCWAANTWATYGDLTYYPKIDGFTLAQRATKSDVKKKKPKKCKKGT